MFRPEDASTPTTVTGSRRPGRLVPAGVLRSVRGGPHFSNQPDPKAGGRGSGTGGGEGLGEGWWREPLQERAQVFDGFVEGAIDSGLGIFGLFAAVLIGLGLGNVLASLLVLALSHPFLLLGFGVTSSLPLLLLSTGREENRA